MLIIDVIYSYLGIWIRVYYLLTKKFALKKRPSTNYKHPIKMFKIPRYPFQRTFPFSLIIE